MNMDYVRMGETRNGDHGGNIFFYSKLGGYIDFIFIRYVALFSRANAPLRNGPDARVVELYGIKSFGSSSYRHVAHARLFKLVV